jgi:GTP cyclohydrolase I
MSKYPSYTWDGFDRWQHKGTPNRVAKMFVKEILGIESWKKPKASTFDNNYKYGEMLVENIIVYSTCEHHLLLIGRAM